jgi:hypothetical protein
MPALVEPVGERQPEHVIVRGGGQGRDEVRVVIHGASRPTEGRANAAQGQSKTPGRPVTGPRGE